MANIKIYIVSPKKWFIFRKSSICLLCDKRKKSHLNRKKTETEFCFTLAKQWDHFVVKYKRACYYYRVKYEQSERRHVNQNDLLCILRHFFSLLVGLLASVVVLVAYNVCMYISLYVSEYFHLLYCTAVKSWLNYTN